MLSHGGDEFWELHRRLGECYRTDVYRSAGFGESSQAMRRFRAAVGEDAGGIKVKSAWGGQTPVEPLPPRSFKSVGPTPEPPDLPAFVMDTFQRQISNPVSSKSKARWSDPAFKDDFVRAVQRKVTFDVQSANAPIEARKTATLTSKDLEAMVTVNPEEAMRFEPREYWRRQGSNPHLAAASATHKVFNSSRRHRGFSSVSVGRSSWTSVLSGVENFLIHPNGRFRSIWSLFGMLFLTWDVVVIPLRFFDIPRSAFSDVMLWLTLVYWNLDILISFLTGYYYKGMLVMRFSNVVSNYLRSWFLLDLTVVCVDWAMTIVALADEGDGATGVARLSKSLRLLHFLRLTRVVRMIKTNAILRHFEENTLSQATMTQYSLFKILGVMLLEQHVIACLWFGVGYLNMTPGATWLSMSGLQQQDVWYQYTTCLHWAFAQLGVGNVEIEAYNVPERAFCICVAVLSLITTATLVSTITSLMTALDKKRNDEMHQFRNLHRFLRHSEIPEELSDRITRLLQYAYHAQTDCTSDSDVPILKLLSKGLRSELQFTRYESALEKLTFLRSLMSSDKQTPQEGKVLQSLATKALYTVEFAQNDVVFCQGGIADAAFLVLSGRFRYTRRMKGFIISDEHWVAEVCLWTPWLYVGEMVAKEIGRSVAVEVEAFCECIGAVWEMRQQATYFAQMVVEDLNTQQVEDLTDVQINALEADVGPRPSRDQRRDSRISSLLSWNASLDQQGSCLRNLCCCRRQGNMVEDHADAVAKSAGVSAPVPVMLEDRTVISSTLVIRSISPGKLTMRSSTLGLLVSPDDNPQYLVVDDVRGPSLISEWNAAQPEELRIHQGDQILAVNGVAGWWEEMLRTIQVQASKPGDLRLRVSQLDHPFADSACDAEPSSIPFGACLAAMSLRMFTGWFQGAEAEAAEAPMAGYAAPVKNTFIHYECDEQPDYRPARSGPARVEDPPTSPLPPGSQSAASVERQLAVPRRSRDRSSPHNLEGTIADVSTMLKLFEAWDKADGKTQVQYMHIYQIPGEYLPKKQVMATIEKAMDTAEDEVLLWYSGHGQSITGNWTFQDYLLIWLGSEEGEERCNYVTFDEPAGEVKAGGAFTLKIRDVVSSGHKSSSDLLEKIYLTPIEADQHPYDLLAANSADRAV
eukprot:s422_g8.t4